ncbi:ATP-binding cassette [Vigna unguiculata]|uniref:ABC-type xenobiotic transporter n=1 Tax=Vigna unguiculata TaxID=3917 RepID=A0A4D6N7U3_VIGUN|nr:ATP-binding cassette [Vigna unguiculata]
MGSNFFDCKLPRVINDCFGFAGSLLLNKLIQFLQQGSVNVDGYLLALSLGLTSIINRSLGFYLERCATTYYSGKVMILKGIMPSTLGVFYASILILLKPRVFSSAQLIAVINDVICIHLKHCFFFLFSLPLQIGVALYLLYTQVKFAFVSGLAITILLIPVNKWIAQLIARATEQMMKEKDERIRKTGELLTSIRTLKMYGWELLFSSWLMDTRSLEVKHLATRKYLDAWCVFFWATTPTLFSLFTFGLYALMGHQLDAAKVFSCLALFNTLISPLNSFPWVINGLIDAIISSGRLSRFLACPEHKFKDGDTNSCPSSFLSEQSDCVQGLGVFIQDACCTWSSSEEQALNMVLNHVTLSVSQGSFVAVIGEVGSGKSSLLYSILGEMQLVRGSVYSNESTAYVPQVPWILSGTVCDNILFGKSYDPERYTDTLKACALDVDISLMIGGDMAYIGEKGVNLSSGQRARLALARALYHDSAVVMLDDVLSAVDVQVAQCILYNAILGPLMQRKTRLLCTLNIQAISSAYKIVPKSFFQIRGAVSLLGTGIVHALEGAEEIVEVELRKEGKVEIGVYKNYAVFTGWFMTVIICLSAILMQASRNGNDLWLSYWVDTTTESSQTRYSVSFYLAILCLFCIINSFFTLVRAFSFAFGGLQAATKVHNKLLNKLMNAPVQFFDQTPGGRILNRLSSDLYTIDDSLPFILNILLANFVGLLGITIILCYVQVFFLLLLLPFWYIYSRLQFFYRSTSREFRRLDSVSRSPIYSSFTETLDGSSTIRAFKSEDFFFTKFTEHVTLYQKTSYTEIVASAFIISFIAVMAVIGSRGSLPINFGLALSYAAPIVSLLGSFLSSFTETEKEMVSVERTLQYMDIPQEEQTGCLYLNPDWPNQGFIEFDCVTLKYMPSLPAALCNLSFRIAGGTQVGIIGRTGAGMSSVLNALFRLTPICTGSISIDGVDIKNISVRELRTHLAIVPQSPFLFEGSLRRNCISICSDCTYISSILMPAFSMF